MNLIQITEQLKNPAITVPQLMQYANNSNPQVPSYVALAEMQRRQSMQAPPQAPQQTVKDQLGAQLMGLPAAAPQQPQQQPPQQSPQPLQGMPQQSPQQPPQGMQQPVPMPQPKQALPTQPGMAGGGLTSIPLNMHHDFAAGGIIAFAQGGDAAGEYPEQTTLEQERAERLKNQEVYGFGGDPYAEAKRRYSDLEKRQLEREKNAGADRFWAGLSTFAGAGPRGFGQSMGMALKTAQDLEEKQKSEGDTQRAKMAELSTLWGKEQDALNRANYAADRGNMEEKRKALREAAAYNLKKREVAAQETSAGASVTSAGASAQNAKTLEEQRKFEQANYPEKFKLEQRKTEADIARAGRPDEFQQRLKLYQTNPTAYNAMFGDKAIAKGALTQDQLIDSWEKMPIQERMQRVKAADGDVIKARNDYIRSNAGLSALPTGVTVTAPNGQTYSFPNAQAAQEFKKKAGIQ
jgi:hypothetical protein